MARETRTTVESISDASGKTTPQRTGILKCDSPALNSLNIALDSAIGFIYFPGSYIEFGGMNAGVISIAAGTNDFVLFVNDPANNPTFGGFSYEQLGDFTFYQSSTVVSTDVPEPASAALLISGLLGLMVRRARRAVRAI